MLLFVGACGSAASELAIAQSDASSAEAAIDAASTDTPAPIEATPDQVGACGLPPATDVGATTPSLVIDGEPGSASGIYDPSLFYPSAAAGGVLAYSSVSDSVHTRIAVSLDLGRTFTYAAEPNQVTPVTVDTSDSTVCGSPTCSGVLWHEVPSIVADDDPDPNRRYKLFMHSYVALPSSALKREWGYIGMQTAPKPEGPWSPEEKVVGWTSSSSFSSSGARLLTDDVPGLTDCRVMTEPGAALGPLGIELALACGHVDGTTVKLDIVLLRSTDSAKSFQFVSTLLRGEDAACLDASVPELNGADLFFRAGAPYLIVTPSGPVSFGLGGPGYRGCLTIPIDDLSAGRIAREPGGAPKVARWIHATDGRFSGPCTYAEGATALGYLVPELFETPPTFRILRTALAAP